MIHHRPQGFDAPPLLSGNLISRASVDGSMVLILRLPFGRGSTGIAESSARIRISRDGNVFLSLPRLGIGTDSYHLLPALVAAELKVAANKIHLEYQRLKDDLLPQEMHMIDSWQPVDAALRAALSEAGAAARLMLTGAAAQRWNVHARSCRAHEGEVIHTTTWRKFRYGELTVDAAYRVIPNEVELHGAVFCRGLGAHR